MAGKSFGRKKKVKRDEMQRNNYKKEEMKLKRESGQLEEGEKGKGGK